MFLRKEVRKVKTGQYKLVQFCKDCGSENIRLVCNKCGSHNIGHPAFNDIMSEDKRGMHEIEEDKTFIVCKCDICGKEYDNRDWNQFIYYYEGEFGAGKPDSDWYVQNEFDLQKDLCNECMSKFVKNLNEKLEEITCKDFVFEQLKELKNIK